MQIFTQYGEFVASSGTESVEVIPGQNPFVLPSSSGHTEEENWSLKFCNWTKVNVLEMSGGFYPQSRYIITFGGSWWLTISCTITVHSSRCVHKLLSRTLTSPI
ncbi:hypothetical protein GDO81_029203 [Engystomops pustulosus]|uniref:Uncharacterized protein n=1 Tax=Engystomops pustulosus TaxID=76066 RepID=A0AAV6YZ15_ENGPU|nr:hypothetical protein GDO81_029203 [Engystomops pustulosus]